MRIETYTPELGQAVEALQRRYIAAQPQGSKFVPKELYEEHPALEGGQNAFCALDRDGVLTGYGALIPTPAVPDSPPDIPNTIWVHIRVDPQVGDWESIQQAIYQAILDKSLTYRQAWPGRETRLAISYPDSRHREIDFFVSQGLAPFDALLRMRRDLSEPPPELSLPPALTVRRWKMEQREEKERYLQIESAVSPQSPRSLEELEFYMRSWLGGTAISAFDRAGQIVSSVMAYWYGGQHGVTEDVFTVPGWRRLGVAKYLLADGIKYLREKGLWTAGLEVKESNQPAVRLYQALDYTIINREAQLALTL